MFGLLEFPFIPLFSSFFFFFLFNGFSFPMCLGGGWVRRWKSSVCDIEHGTGKDRRGLRFKVYTPMLSIASIHIADTPLSPQLKEREVYLIYRTDCGRTAKITKSSEKNDNHWLVGFFRSCLQVVVLQSVSKCPCE